MSTAPPVQESLLALGQTLLVGTTTMMSTFILLGLVIYFCYCLRASRRWNGMEGRWERPR